MSEATQLQVSISQAPTTTKCTSHVSLQELQQSKDELAARVQTLRRELKDWRASMAEQLTSCNAELADLRKQFVLEVQVLQAEFQDIRASLQQHVEQAGSSHVQHAGS